MTIKSTKISLTDAIDDLVVQMQRQYLTGIRLGGVPFWIGAPGLGKTEVQKATAKHIARQLGSTMLVHTTTLADIEVTDVKGMALPAKNSDGVLDRIVYTRSGILPSPEEEDEYDFIFLQIDEVPAATLDHAKVINQLLAEYRLGSVHLDPCKYFVAVTGNGIEHKSGAIRMPAHSINRVSWMDIEPDVGPALQYFATPEARMPPLGRAFVEFRPGLFTDDVMPDTPNTPFPTIRSFTNGMHHMLGKYAACPYDQIPDAFDPASIAAAFTMDNKSKAEAKLSTYVGTGVASEFMAFARVREQLVPLNEIVADPDGCRVPTDVAACFAQTSYMIQWITDKNCAALARFVMRLRADMRVATFMSMKDKCPALLRVKEFVEFARQNAGLVQTTLSARNINA